MGEDWVGTFLWTAGADVRYDFTKKAFLLLKADYVQMRPEFTVTAIGERVKAVQHMSMVNVNASSLESDSDSLHVKKHKLPGFYPGFFIFYYACKF